MDPTRISTFACLGAAAMLFALPTKVLAEETTREFTPVGEWVLDYREESCALGREYSSNGQSLTMMFETFIGGPNFNIVLATSDLSMPDRPLSFRFEPDSENQIATGYRRDVTDSGVNVAAFQANLMPTSAQARGPAESMGIGWSAEDMEVREQFVTGVFWKDWVISQSRS